MFSGFSMKNSCLSFEVSNSIGEKSKLEKTKFPFVPIIVIRSKRLSFGATKLQLPLPITPFLKRNVADTVSSTSYKPAVL